MQNDLEYRIQKLEKSNKRLRSFLLICAIFISGGLIVGIAEADRLLRIDRVETVSLSTGELSLIDSKGKRRLFMGLSKDESVSSIMIYGADSVKPVIALSALKDGLASSISLADSKGKDKVVIRTDKEDNVSLYYFNNDGKVIGGFLNTKGMPMLYAQKVHVTDTMGIPRASLIADEKDQYQPKLSFFDATSKLRAGMFFSEKGISGLGFFDKNLKNRGLFGILPQGQSYLLINDSLGKRVLMIPDLQ